ncbi:MAG TPA: adenylate/guanylate cyclase domain-containing protein [Kamptonema sp.]|nr:adenylate/guanylate cyclase domain-containing protein [Kamptonema sp.]
MYIVCQGAKSKAMQEEQLSREELLLEIEKLRQEVENLNREKADLEILLDTTAQHSDSVEAELHDKALEAVREGEAKLAQFLEAIPVGVAVLDAAGTPYYANRAAVQLLGKGVVPSVTVYKIPDIYQLYVADTDCLYPSEKLPISRALKGENSRADDLEVHQGDKIIPLESWGTPIFDSNGKVAYAISVFQDISDRKKAEAERQRFTNELFELNSNLEKALDAELELTDAYGRFVPHQFLHFLGYESIVDVKLGDQVQQEMSVLFADIRDFTSLSETLTPEENFKFINAYLSRMEPAITENNGFIDKYIGDAIMALFNGDADQAVKAGISLLHTLANYNQHRQDSGYMPIKIGVGINTGTLMLGTVGGQNRMDSTVISDAVNLASRIEGLTKDYGVQLLISNQTFSRLQKPDNYDIRIVDQVKVKGKSEFVTVYEVFDADPPEIREGKLSTLKKYKEAMLLYHQNIVKEAGKLFEECLQKNPEDRVAQIYLKRCRNFFSVLKKI